MNKTILFLGSGVSIPSGMPDISQITDALFQEEWHHHTDDRFYPGPNKNINIPDKLTPGIVNYLLIIRNLLRFRLQPDTYEDLYYILQQIKRNNNQAIYDFMEKIKFMLSTIDFGDSSYTINDISDKACHFIECVTKEKLSESFVIENPIGFDLINELHKNNINIDIFTLNHDLLLEKYLDLKKIPFDDGFNRIDGEIRYIDEKLFSSSKDNLKLVKLHGSINWIYYDNSKLGIATNGDTDHATDSSGKRPFPFSTEEFLTGKENKIEQYSSFYYSKFFHYFQNVLNETNRIIMSGYGWNDLGINQRLSNWLVENNENKIILLHEKPEELKRSRSNLWYKYDDYIKRGSIIPIRKWLCDTKLDDIREYLK